MKIAFMTSGSIHSSLSYRPLAFAKELVKNGHKVYIFCPKFDKYSNFKAENIKEIEGVKIVELFQAKNVPFIASLIPYIISSIIGLIKLQPDIIHIFKANPITITGLVGRFYGKKVILDVDDLDVEVMRIEKNPRFMVLLVKAANIIITKYATAITVASMYLKKLYSSKSKPVIIIPNGAEFIEAPKKTSLKNNVVFIGNINRKNILEPLFIATKKLVEKKIKVSIKVIGDGKYLPYFKKIVKKNSLTKYVSFLGFVNRSKLKNYVSYGDLGYSYMPNEPTIKACSSMKIFQYMQYGVVPVVSNVGEFPQYTYNGKAGYIAESSNTQSLANTLYTALKNKNERIKKVNFAQKNAKKDYQWSVLSEKINRWYKKLYEKN